jgi:hypothetical protein
MAAETVPARQCSGGARQGRHAGILACWYAKQLTLRRWARVAGGSTDLHKRSNMIAPSLHCEHGRTQQHSKPKHFTPPNCMLQCPDAAPSLPHVPPALTHLNDPSSGSSSAARQAMSLSCFRASDGGAGGRGKGRGGRGRPKGERGLHQQVGGWVGSADMSPA